MNRTRRTFQIMVALVVCLAQPTWAEQNGSEEATNRTAASNSGFGEVPRFGGPQSVGGQLREDDETTGIGSLTGSLERGWSAYNAWKGSINETYGLSFGGDYTAMWQGASNSPGEDSAAGGIFRFFGSWTVLGRDTGNTGTIVYKVENRHRLRTRITPKDLGFEIGYAGFTAPIYADYRWGLTNLYWQQRLSEGRFTFVAGLVDVTDYLDVYGMINPWTSFSNLAFQTNPSIPAPNQGLGLAAGAMITDRIYAVAGLADTNGDPTKPGDLFDSFFDDREYFKHAEIGWTGSKDRIYLDNVHLTYWRVDHREVAQTPSGWGLTFSAAKFFNDTWMPFLRAGYAKEGGALYDRTVSAGLGYYREARKDLVGFGLNWSRPSETSFGPDLPDQWTAELFYRFQLSDHLAVTPDLQYIKDPALNPEKNQIWVAGIRARLAF